MADGCMSHHQSVFCHLTSFVEFCFLNPSSPSKQLFLQQLRCRFLHRLEHMIESEKVQTETFNITEGLSYNFVKVHCRRLGCPMPHGYSHVGSQPVTGGPDGPEALPTQRCCKTGQATRNSNARMLAKRPARKRRRQRWRSCVDEFNLSMLTMGTSLHNLHHYLQTTHCHSELIW